MTPIDVLLGDAQTSRPHLTYRGNVKNGRHGWLRLTPAYSLHLVEQIVGTCTEDDLVLDPFSGTGTTPLVCAAHGVRGHAVDINPFLVWLGNLKTTRFPEGAEDDLLAAARRIASSLKRRRNWTDAWVPDIHQIEKWWDAETISLLSRLYAAISRTQDEFGTHIVDLLRVAFCQVMIGQANVSFGHQSMSFKKRDDNATQQLSLFKETKRDDLLASFLQDVEFVATGVIEDQPRAKAIVILGDSRTMRRALHSHSYTKVITSPPYPNRMSYIRELRPYMYWLGYLSNGRQAGELDWQAIGGTWGCATSNLGSWKPDSDQPVPFPRFDAIVRSIGQDHTLLGRYVHKYFVDIQQHIRSLRDVLVSGAQCFYVIGNSKFYGTMLPAQDIYAALFDNTGFHNIRIETLRKRSSKKELFEYVVYAEAP